MVSERLTAVSDIQCSPVQWSWWATGRWGVEATCAAATLWRTRTPEHGGWAPEADAGSPPDALNTHTHKHLSTSSMNMVNCRSKKKNLKLKTPLSFILLCLLLLLHVSVCTVYLVCLGGISDTGPLRCCRWWRPGVWAAWPSVPAQHLCWWTDSKSCSGLQPPGLQIETHTDFISLCASL